MGTKEVTHSTIRDWLIVQIANIVKCPPSDIGVEESFTALGLDSMATLSLTGDLAAWLGRDLPATLLLRYATVEDLAESLTEMSLDELEPPPPREAGKPMPVTFAQERLLKHASLPPGRDANLLNPRFVLRGPLDIDGLRGALTEMVRRHEILRTTFHRQDGTFVQVVHPPETAVMDVVDWSAGNESQSEEQVILRARALLLQPVDLGELPLFRSLVVRVAENDHRLLFLFHHLLCDAGTLRVFYDELSRIYFANRKGFLAALEPLDWQYADFASWERNWLQKDGAPYQERLQWWEEYWRKPVRWPDLAFAWKQPPPELPPLSACRLTEPMDEDTRARANALARQCQATSHAVFFAAFAWHLLNQTRETELVIGTYVSDRKRVAAGRLLGLFTSLLAVRVSIPRGITFHELIRQSQETLDAMSLRRELPFEHLVEHLEAAGKPVPKVHTVFQQRDAPDEILQLDGLQTNACNIPVAKKTTSGLSFAIINDAAQTKARVTFDGTRYNPEAMQYFLTSFLQRLHTLVHAPDAGLDFDSQGAPRADDWESLFGPG